ncbi:MAG: hypothetical protein OXB99_02005 [Acidimicrobiaceae bacterium]|nr:hypothetical protein [Acidimicrobiaceae bacterium]
MSNTVSVLLAAGGFTAGAAVAVTAVVAPRARSVRRSAAEAMLGMLPEPRPSRRADLRLAGITPRTYTAQRAAGLAGGMAVGTVAATLWTATPVAAAVAVTLIAVAGWQLPAQSVRDAARRARAELDQVVRLWIVLAAQQVSAGSDPETAMLSAAGVGRRTGWRLLHQHLRRAQNERRPAAEGLAELVERYSLTSLTAAVGAFELAARRGTRMADAVLAAADNLWRDTLGREREAAERRNQIIVLPATAVALALAAILIYPPFVSLTGGIITQAP